MPTGGHGRTFDLQLHIGPWRPLIIPVASSGNSPSSLRPPTPTIVSPDFRPARAAGEPLNTRSIVNPRSSGATSTPMP